MNAPVITDQDWTPYDMLPVGIIIIRSDYTILSWNDCIANWTGITPQEIVGTSLLHRFLNLNKRLYLARIEQVFSGGPAVIFSPQFHPHFIPAPLPNGELRIQSTTVVPIQQGPGFHAMIVIEDVTDLTRQVRAFRDMKNIADRELDERKKADAALVLSNKKLNLLSSITRHDILNQLMGLRTYIEVMKEYVSDPEALGYLAKEVEATENIGRQIEFTRSYQEIGVNSPVWQNVQALIRDAAGQLVQKKIKVKIALPDIEVFADPLLQRVFFNLVDNALRHSETMTTFRFEGKESTDGFTLICQDNGVGVLDENKEKIFRREYFRHTGLGLYLSREILSITGITIRETGKPGKGARFEILIPPASYRLINKK